jgi:tRNA nucleotidyltransferase (CCA-adding enzyme)
MQIYLVGGAIRDRLLGRPVKERDFVVVGATPEAMLSLGYRQVGRDFPVFLHPRTQEEYALARTQREQMTEGHPHADPAVTLEQDLERRDLTINAIAQNLQGELVDPFGGEKDLKQRVLRHVSPAFTEDPVRVLRVARFMARYSALGFKVADETLSLMRGMVENDRLDHLVPERIWQELIRALGEDDPRLFFDTLRACGALARVLPEIDNLFGVPQPTCWHPEVDCGIHTMMALGVACELSRSIEVRFAALTHDLGKATTPEHILPSHHGHERRGEHLVKSLCDRLKAPTRFRELATKCASFHGYIHKLYELRPATVVKLLTGLDAFRRPEILSQFLLVCEADYRGRKGFYSRPYPHADDLFRLFESARGATLCSTERASEGWRRAEAIRRARVKRIAESLVAMRPLTRETVKDSKSSHIGPDGGTDGTEDENQQGA